MSELVEFLLARVAEEEADDREAFLVDCPPEHREWAAARWDKTLSTATLRYGIAVRQLGWAIAEAIGMRGRLLRKASEYADHPDYREEWNR
jgi:hypothetical protein